MFESIDTDRVSNGFATASTGYMAAAVAAYAEMMTFGFDMWQAALAGMAGDAAPGSPQVVTARPAEPAFGHSRDDWNGLPWFDSDRMAQISKLAFSTDPFDVFCCFAAFSPLRGNAAAWPIAKQMIDAGVPRAIAWPAAEANAAAMDATVAVSAPLRRVYATAHTDSGFAMPQAMAGGLAQVASITLPFLVFMMWTLPAIAAART